MIIGSGLLAQAFSSDYAGRADVCIYAAGVSNSHCIDIREFEREHRRLEEALQNAKQVNAFVYFGTCSIADPYAIDTPYVQHKLAMERVVSAHPKSLILRLPQVAGRTPNPHTLLNFLFSRISRSERFQLWSKAQRNVIDVMDVVSITRNLIADDSIRSTVVNIANPVNYAMSDIVRAMEVAIGKKAIYDKVEQGGAYRIDVDGLAKIFESAKIQFDDDYLDRVVIKYYQERIDG